MNRPEKLGFCGFGFHAQSMADKLLFDTNRACFFVDDLCVVGNQDKAWSEIIKGWGAERDSYQEAKKYFDELMIPGLKHVVLVPEYEDHDATLDEFTIPKNVCFWTGADDNSVVPGFRSDYTVAILADRRPLYAASAAAIVLYERMRQVVTTNKGNKSGA